MLHLSSLLYFFPSLKIRFDVCARVRCNRLDISWNNLTDACMPALSDALRSAPLKTLVLSGNRGIGAVGLDALGRGIATAGCKLESLDLSECELNDEAIQKFSIHMPSMAPLQR